MPHPIRSHLLILVALVLLGCAVRASAQPTYTGEVCYSGSSATVSVTATPTATAVLIYPQPIGGGYFMTDDGSGTYSRTFSGLASGTDLTFEFVIQVPQQYEFEPHVVTLASGCESFTSEDAGGGNNGGGNNGGGDDPLVGLQFTHDVVSSGGGYAVEIETAPPASPLPATSSVELRYRVNDGAMQSLSMSGQGAFVWSRQIPGLGAGDLLRYAFVKTVGQELVDTTWFERVAGQDAPPAPTFPIVTTGASRFRDRHENEWRFDHYVAGYDVGRTFDVEITDHGDRLDIRLTTAPEVPVNAVDIKWYSQSGPAQLCDRNISAISQRMDTDANGFYSTIPDVAIGQRVDIEFTLLASQTYYSEFMYYDVGQPGLRQRSNHPLAYATDDASISAVTIKQFAFNQHTLNLSSTQLRDFVDGKILFETRWDDGLLFNPPTAFDCNGGPVGFNMGASPVFDPSLLGPLYSNNSCIECHMLDGRGSAESIDDYVVQVGVPGAGAGQEPLPHPHYGRRFDHQSIGATPTEGQASVTWEMIQGAFDDGTPYELRRPVLEFDDLRYGAVGSNVPGTVDPAATAGYAGVAEHSLRIAPMLIGLGLLEAVGETEILAWADETDSDGDGVSGRPNMVLDRSAGALALGRFGWKAGQPSLRQQAAAAFRDDMGMTNALYPTHDCTPVEPECDTLADDSVPEVSDVMLDQMESYLRGLAVPPRENYADPLAIQGKAVFEQARCDACHRPVLETSASAAFVPYRSQTIQPFTDMLLHDMGDGLADGRPEFAASGREWRTPPLWGIGYVAHVLSTPNDPFDPDSNLETPNYLHDGRARSLMEAILWHGGEASFSRDVVLTLSASERDALIEYVKFPFIDPDEISTVATGGCDVPAIGCTITTSDNCTALAGVYAGDDTDCARCVCEFGGAPETVDVQDLLAYLALWFNADAGADLNGGGTDITDLLEFLSCWFNADTTPGCV